MKFPRDTRHHRPEPERLPDVAGVADVLVQCLAYTAHMQNLPQRKVQDDALRHVRDAEDICGGHDGECMWRWLVRA